MQADFNRTGRIILPKSLEGKFFFSLLLQMNSPKLMISMKKLSFLFLMMLLPLMASSETVEIDGIYYNLISKGKIAEVTSNPQKYHGVISIPDTVRYDEVTYSVTSIGSEAFSYCSALDSIALPNSLTNIGKMAFFVCTSLTTMKFPENLTTIGESSF